MKKNAGIIAILAAVMALFGISNLSKNSSSGPVAAETEKGAKPPGTGTIKSGLVNDSCREILKRLQLFVSSDQLKTWNYLHSCYASNKTGDDQEKINPLSSFPDVDFVIASVPNPMATHLPLLFDRMLEIIEQAAQDNNYLYDSSWLPWDEPKDYSSLADQVAAKEALDIQENQPGLLVFRKPITNAPNEGGLAVFVVSELPTGGINREQFENALKWIYQLGDFSSKNQVKILGPTFSGSLPSLYSLITSITSRPPPSMPLSRKLSFRISSGTVSSESDGAWFKQQLQDPSTFETAMGGDCVLVKRFLNYVQSQKYDPDRVAVLSEDETAFGGSISGIKQDDKLGTQQDNKLNVCAPSTRQTYLYYPRDIATLRSAYEQQAIFSSGKQAPNTNTSVTTLRGDLSEPANSKHDTVRSYGGQLTPLAQESVLLSIVEVIKERKIQFVVLRSTNSLDQIFLSQFLRRLAPDARIVIDGTDLLFRRGAEGTSLRGVMALSTYPLLTWPQDWTFDIPVGKEGSYRIFGEDAAEGLYIAARGLFLDQGSSVSTNSLGSYAPPAWAQSLANDDEDKRPATWLTVIGHRQFWPVAVLTSHTIRGKTKDFPAYPVPDIVRLLPVDFRILLFLCLAWSILHLAWCSRASISPEPSLFRLTYFAPVPHWQHSALIGFGSIIVAAVAFILAAPLNLLNWEPGLWNGFVAGVILAVFIFPCVGCMMNYDLEPMADDLFTKEVSSRCRQVAGIALPVLLALLLLLDLAIARGLNTSNRIPVFWRDVHLSNGVSPLLPQLLLIAGMYCWFWSCLRGLALFGDDRPLLPKEADLPLPFFSRTKAGEPTEKLALPIGGPYFAALGPVLAIVLIVCRTVLEGFWLRTLGEKVFGRYIFFWLVLCISLILADTAQAWRIWIRLRVLLMDLDRLPLRRTISALRGFSWRSVWAMSGNVLSERYCLLSRQIEAWRHLKNQIAAWKPADLAETKQRDELIEKLVDRPQTGEKIDKVVQWYKNLCYDPDCVKDLTLLSELQEELAAIAASVFCIVLAPSWKNESDSLILERWRKPNAEPEDSGGQAISSNIRPHVIAAEEFFVLPYMGFIQNILGRIRTIVLGSLFLFVAATLAVSSYPFDPQPVLGYIFLAVFLVTGTALIVIYAGMHRDATLSHMTGTTPGELGIEFWQQLLTFGVVPLIGLLTTLFPSITDFVSSWLQPSSQLIK